LSYAGRLQLINSVYALSPDILHVLP
jgi:hypothetical protein